MEAIKVLAKILTNILTALYEPFGFSLLLSFFAMFFYLYAYEPSAAGKGWKNAIVTWYQKFKESVFFRKLFFLAFVTSLILFRTLLNRQLWMNPLSDVMGGWGIWETVNGEQIESASVITKAGIAAAMEDEVEESHKEIKGIQKEYITILGIFAAIMLAFVGAFTFSTSVLNNLGKADTLELVVVAIVIGLVFVLLISILIDFLRDINDKVVCDKNGKKQWNKKVVSGIALLTLIAVVTVICIGISRMSFPQQINIGQHRYQLVEESTEDSANKLDVDCPEKQEE